MSLFSRRDVQLTIIIICFLINFVPYFVEIKPLEDASVAFMTITSVANAFALALALVAQTRRSLDFVTKRLHGWPYEIVLLAVCYFMIIVGVFISETSPGYVWFIEAFQMPMASVIFSIQTLYMASAAARSMRARNVRSMILIIIGVISLLGMAPYTSVVAPQFLGIANFVRNTFSKTLTWAVGIGSTVGGIVFGVRILTGKESRAMGVETG
jgi:hypothetical protein